MKRVFNTLCAVFLLAIALFAFNEPVTEPTLQDSESLMKSRTQNFEATDFYWYGDKKILLQKIEGKFYIEFYSKDEYKIREECARKDIKLYNVHAISDFAQWVVEGTEGPGAKVFTGIMNGWMEGANEQCAEVLSASLYWSPFYQYEDLRYGETKIASMFTVVLKPGTTLQQIEELAAKNGVEMIGKARAAYASNWYRLACTIRSKGYSLEMANLFYEIGLFETAFPSLIGGRASE